MNYELIISRIKLNYQMITLYFISSLSYPNTLLYYTYITNNFVKYLYPLNQIPNFFIWWYGVQGRIILEKAVRFILKTIGYLNLIPMVLNLHRSFFADKTISGYIYSFILRLIWIFFALVIFMPIFFLVGLVVISWFLFPIYVILAIINPLSAL